MTGEILMGPIRLGKNRTGGRRSLICLACLLFLCSGMRSPAQVVYDDYFSDRAMRLDLYQIGNAKDESITLDRIIEEPVWPETRDQLIDPFGYGRYVLKLYDVASNRLIYSRGFDGMFAEYKTTTPAIDGVKRVFQRSVRIPYPKRPALFVIEVRDKKNLLSPLFTRTIDPEDYHILHESNKSGDWVYEPFLAGDLRKVLDLVFLAEGYTAEERNKFQADVDRFAAALFATEPYKTAKTRISIRGIFRPSAESAMDEPRQKVYRKTVLDASFNAFDLDRYMLIEADHRMHEMAAQVPYDAIVVLVNSKRYGGGSIAFDYCVTTVDNQASIGVFLHELGHSFGGLADEYYSSEVAYNDFYPKGVEPFEPNITALLDPENVKWKGLLSPGIGIPTEYGKERTESLQAERQKNRAAWNQQIATAKEKGASADQLKSLQEKAGAADKEIADKIEAVRKEYRYLEGKVGVFEGAGYASRGLYRPQMYCLMISNPKNEFCAVCRKALNDMIQYFAP
jgi:hypothetical protein